MLLRHARLALKYTLVAKMPLTMDNLVLLSVGAVTPFVTTLSSLQSHLSSWLHSHYLCTSEAP